MSTRGSIGETGAVVALCCPAPLRELSHGPTGPVLTPPLRRGPWGGACCDHWSHVLVLETMADRLARECGAARGHHGCDRATQDARPRAQPRCALPLRGTAGRGRLGPRLRGPGLGREHARLQLPLPPAAAHLHAGGLAELVRARRLPRHGRRRQRAGRAFATAGERVSAARRDRDLAARARRGERRTRAHRGRGGARAAGGAGANRARRPGRSDRLFGAVSARGRRPPRRDDLPRAATLWNGCSTPRACCRRSPRCSASRSTASGWRGRRSRRRPSAGATR